MVEKVSVGKRIKVQKIRNRTDMDHNLIITMFLNNYSIKFYK